MLQEKEYKEYCSKFKAIENYLRKNSENEMEVALNICKLRGYYPERMCSTLVSAGFMYIKDNLCLERLEGIGYEYGLFSKNGRFLLENRYIFPVKDMLGNTIALIGWYPDERKYITTPSKFFSKQCLFYGMEQFSRTGIGKNYIIVEGIFDALSVRSLGINCVAMMGITSSKYKSIMYSLFSNIVAIPDNDAEGRDVILNDKWSLPSKAKYFRWMGDKSKDIDDFVNSYEEEDIKELLQSIFKEKGRVISYRV